MALLRWKFAKSPKSEQREVELRDNAGLTLPENIDEMDAGDCEVEEIDLKDHNLDGRIPQRLRDLKKLRLLDLSSTDLRAANQLTGNLGDLEALVSIKELKLGGNHFTETIGEVADESRSRDNGHNFEIINALWSMREFVFKDWRLANGEKWPTLQGTAEIMQAFEEALINLTAMLSRRQGAMLRKRASGLMASLGDASKVLEKWVRVQQLWCDLEPVFGIAHERSINGTKLEDYEWGELMRKALNVKRVLECCTDKMLDEGLDKLLENFEQCQKSLNSYLDTKKRAFPRLYFVSAQDLLHILRADLDTMSTYIPNILLSVGSFEHDGTRVMKILDIGGKKKGSIAIELSPHVDATENAEEWLVELVKRAQQTIKAHTAVAASRIAAHGLDPGQLRDFVDSTIAQLTLLSVTLMWTAENDIALAECSHKPNALEECKWRQHAILTELASWCREDLGSRANRTKILALIPICVHQRDVTAQLVTLFKQKKIEDANLFEWTSQARSYWRADASDDTSKDGACIISIADVDLNYSYEYLGNTARLVITPLTVRCYLTLAQAVSMFFGGAPQGPAGTGKTETVKDLACMIAITCYVFNCSDQMDFQGTANIFRGLASSGTWGCFDEFNRIRLPVLSVVAQQVLSIQNAKKAGTRCFQFEGDSLTLSMAVNYFITMNPGYAGRTELPDNLKALFRGVTMMVPDLGMICEVMLYSEGFEDAKSLSRKMLTLYTLSKDQLSKQRHYDWGLRAIKSVLVASGANKRKNLDEPEAILLYQTLRDMNVSKLIPQDIPVFLSLMAGLFPQVPEPPKADNEELEKQLRESVEKNGLVFWEGSSGSADTRGGWVSKVLQLYEATRVRHGIALVGPTGGGKSTAFRQLRAALDKTPDSNGRLTPHLEVRINPKALTAAELYGYVSLTDGHWTDGVLSRVFRETTQGKPNPSDTWIILDGPIDATWMESLNTLLDDNKILALASNERIPLKDHVKMCFEAENLNNSSPAAVSRLGITYLSDIELDWCARMSVAASYSSNAPSSCQGSIHSRLDERQIQNNDQDTAWSSRWSLARDLHADVARAHLRICHASSQARRADFARRCRATAHGVV